MAYSIRTILTSFLKYKASELYYTIILYYSLYYQKFHNPKRFFYETIFRLYVGSLWLQQSHQFSPKQD